MALVILHHIIGYLTIRKPKLVKFHDFDTIESVIKAIRVCAKGAITICKKRKDDERRSKVENFVKILNSLDVVAFIVKVGDHESMLKMKVVEVVKVNLGLLKEVDPITMYGFN